MPPTPDGPAIDLKEPMASRSRATLMRAEREDRILAFKAPVDSRHAGQMARLREALAGEVPMPPKNSGTYYHFHVADPQGRRVQVVLGEGEVLAGIFMYVLAHFGPEAAAAYEYRAGALGGVIQ